MSDIDARTPYEVAMAALREAEAELAAVRARHAELVRASTALVTHWPLGILSGGFDPVKRMEWATERDSRWLAVRAALAELASPCICSDIDVTSFTTPQGVRDVVRNVEPMCPEHGKGTGRVDQPE